MITCDKCKYWHLMEDEPILAQNNGRSRGRCMRRPPIASSVVMPVVKKIAGTVEYQLLDRTIWPITVSDVGCGEGSMILEEVELKG